MKYSTYTWSARSPSWKCTNSNTRSTMVPLMGDNVGDDTGWENKVISSTAMESSSGDTGDGEDV